MKMKLNSVWVGSLLFLFAIGALGNSKYNKFDSSLHIGLQVKGSYQRIAERRGRERTHGGSVGGGVIWVAASVGSVASLDV